MAKTTREILEAQDRPDSHYNKLRYMVRGERNLPTCVHNGKGVEYAKKRGDVHARGILSWLEMFFPKK